MSDKPVLKAPWNLFEKRSAPSPLYANSVEEAQKLNIKTSHKKFLDHRREQNIIDSVEWSLIIASWNAKISPRTTNVSLPMLILESGHFVFEEKIFGGVVDIVWYLLSMNRMNTSVRASMSIVSKNDVRFRVKFKLESSWNRIHCSFALAPIADTMPMEISDSDTPVLPRYRIAVNSPLDVWLPTTPICAPRAAAQPDADSHREPQPPAPEPQPATPEPPPAEIVPDAQPSIDLKALLQTRTANTQRELDEEDFYYRLKRDALQQQLDSLDKEHQVKRARLKGDITIAAHALREELEQQWRALAAQLQK